MPAAEGVIRFEVDHAWRDLDPRALGVAARTLGAWRELLARLGLVGRHPARYEGLGYGNVSARIGPFGAAPRGRRRFLVTGSQTGGRERLGLEDFCVVERWELATNRVTSFGRVPPSSESLTHGAVYDAAPAARVVLHAHCPEIWRAARALGLPVSDPAAANGTPAMAQEVLRLWRESALPGIGMLALGGHEDGVLAFGHTPEEAGGILVRQLARALALDGAGR